MRNLKAVLLLTVIAAVSVLTVLYGGVSVAFGSFSPLPEDTLSGETEELSSEQEVSSHPSVQEQTQSEIPTVSSETESTSSAVAAAENHTVSGKIISRFIDPTAASLGYNNIYIKNNTDAAIDIKNELEQGLSFKINKSSEPEVLIVHTHATESFMLEERDYYTTTDYSRTTDETKNMIAVGEIVAAEIKAAGFSVLHDKTLHDYPSYTGSYTVAAKTIKSYLEKYPSIKIVLDIHRDAIGGGGNDKAKVVKEINGKNAAQVMLVMGSQTGNVSGFPNWKQNLRLAMRFHQKLETMYPGLARPLLLKSSKYNQNLTTGSMLLEVGTDANTLDEAKYSAELVGKALSALLSDLR